MINSLDVYILARQKFSPMDSIRYTIIDLVKNDLKFKLMTDYLNHSARVIELGLLDILKETDSDKINIIKNNITKESVQLSKYLTWELVNMFVIDELSKAISHFSYKSN